MASDAQALFERGHAALAAGDTVEAVECFTRAIRLAPRVAAGYRARAAAYRARNERGKAIADLGEAIRLRPDDAQLYAERAAELLRQRSYDAAIADCDAAGRLDPARADVFAVRGRCHAEQGNAAAAEADFLAAIDRDPDAAATYLLQLARLRLELERYADAVADADAALRADPEFAAGYEVRAAARRGLGDLRGAADDYAAAIEREPASAARLGLAATLHDLGEWAGAVDAVDALLDSGAYPAAHAARLAAHDVRARCRLQLGDLDGALADADAVVVGFPKRPAGFSLRGHVRAARGDWPAAYRDHLAAVTLAPDDAGALNQLAWVLATCPDESVRHPERAVEFATRACEKTEWANADFLDTLAAARAALSKRWDADDADRSERG